MLPPLPGSEGWSPAGCEQTCSVPGKVSALAAGTRAGTTRQVSHRCLGSGGAGAAAGLRAEKQPLPLDGASPTDTGSSPRGGFRGTTLWKWVQGSRAQESRAARETLRSQDRLSTGSIVTAAPRPFLGPSDPTQRRELCSHTEPKYRFPFPVQEHAIFCCIHF